MYEYAAIVPTAATSGSGIRLALRACATVTVPTDCGPHGSPGWRGPQVGRTPGSPTVGIRVALCVTSAIRVKQFREGGAAGQATETDEKARVDVLPLLLCFWDLPGVLVWPCVVGLQMLVGPSEDLLNSNRRRICLIPDLPMLSKQSRQR